MSGSYFIIALAAFTVTIILLFLLRRLAVKKAQGVPLIGGIAMALAFFLACLSGFKFYGAMPKEAAAIIISSSIMLVFGLVDDWRELSILLKFLAQIIAVSLLIFLGVRTQIAYIGQPANIIITFLWVIGITNAVNHLDVMDGLAAGTAVIVALSLFEISLLGNNTSTAVLSLGLAAAACGFLAYNLPPAKVYMGNSGSHFLGFVLASIAILISYAPLERKIALLSPILILGLPIFDTAFLMLARLKRGILPFRKSNDHPALKLSALGYPKKKALAIMLAVCLFFCISGVILSQVSNLFGAVIIAAVIVAFLLLAKIMSSLRADA